MEYILLLPVFCLFFCLWMFVRNEMIAKERNELIDFVFEDTASYEDKLQWYRHEVATYDQMMWRPFNRCIIGTYAAEYWEWKTH